MQDDLDGSHSEDSGGEQLLKVGTPLREQDRFLPIANITKIMKKSVPSNGKIAKEARECIQECVSEFISFITSEASDRCHMEKRKTINGEDILCAMYALGFENYIEPLKLYLSKYKDNMITERQHSDESHEPMQAGETSRQESDSLSAQVLPNVIGDTETIYQSEGNSLYFKDEPYEQM
ncbi:nuclear transcription factor Y subunit beta [Anopheles moucheti]|uniref:nuclear transcription factor Y subunit beta n=1 Tax=Anopheles moucheti TaxID=186751 RepID=UPI0022F0E96A|nr:nuclear transcription factor Y subunit beta [Anopheles moucheti]